MPTAILIDGAYFIKRFRSLDPEHAYDAARVADCAHQWACAHLVPQRRNGAPAGRPRELYRIFFYDCPPLQKKMGSLSYSSARQLRAETSLGQAG
ncbi:hypothetical protein [Cupriavidus sp. 8B]